MSTTLLKILTGPHMGAEAVLESGDVLLGSDLECDIILMDAGIMPRHLLLRVSHDDTVLVLPQEGDVLLKDVPVPAEGALLEHFCPLTMGGTVLCVGPAKRPWRSHELPTLAFLDSQAKTALERLAHMSAENSAEVGSNTASSTIDTAMETNKTNAATTTLNGSAPTHERITLDGAPQNIAPQKISKFRRSILLLCLLILLALITLGVRTYLSEDSATIINNILYEGDYEHVELVHSDGTYSLTGFVPLNNDIVYIEDMLKGLEETVSVKLFSVEQVKELTENLIKEAEAPWVIRQKRHELSIVGYAQTQEVGEKLLEEVRARLDAVGATISFVTWAQMQETLTKDTQFVQLSGKMHIYPDVLRVGIATRVLDEQEQAGLERILLKTTEFFAIPSPFVRMANLKEQPVKKPQQVLVQTPAAPVRNICELLWWQNSPNSTQGLALELMGQSYIQGKRLPSGWLIQELNVKYAVLVLDNQMRVCNAQIKP